MQYTPWFCLNTSHHQMGERKRELRILRKMHNEKMYMVVVVLRWMVYTLLLNVAINLIWDLFCLFFENFHLKKFWWKLVRSLVVWEKVERKVLFFWTKKETKREKEKKVLFIVCRSRYLVFMEIAHEKQRKTRRNKHIELYTHFDSSKTLPIRKKTSTAQKDVRTCINLVVQMALWRVVIFCRHALSHLIPLLVQPHTNTKHQTQCVCFKHIYRMNRETSGACHYYSCAVLGFRLSYSHSIGSTLLLFILLTPFNVHYTAHWITIHHLYVYFRQYCHLKASYSIWMPFQLTEIWK